MENGECHFYRNDMNKIVIHKKKKQLIDKLEISVQLS